MLGLWSGVGKGLRAYVVVCVHRGIELAIPDRVADVDVLLPPLLDEVRVVAEVAVFTRDAAVDLEDAVFAQAQSRAESVWYTVVGASNGVLASDEVAGG